MKNPKDLKTLKTLKADLRCRGCGEVVGTDHKPQCWYDGRVLKRDCLLPGAETRPRPLRP